MLDRLTLNLPKVNQLHCPSAKLKAAAQTPQASYGCNSHQKIPSAETSSLLLMWLLWAGILSTRLQRNDCETESMRPTFEFFHCYAHTILLVIMDAYYIMVGIFPLNDERLHMPPHAYEQQRWANGRSGDLIAPSFPAPVSHLFIE